MLKQKNLFLAELDRAVPEYGKARAIFKGDAEVRDALRLGMKDCAPLQKPSSIQEAWKERQRAARRSQRRPRGHDALWNLRSLLPARGRGCPLHHLRAINKLTT